jgi:hypothetical protein
MVRRVVEDFGRRVLETAFHKAGVLERLHNFNIRHRLVREVPRRARVCGVVPDNEVRNVVGNCLVQKRVLLEIEDNGVVRRRGT